MKNIVAMDESGNTQKIIAIGLVSIPYKEISKINLIFSLSEKDPHEIQVLYNKKSGGEFKYVDLRNAFRQTRLDVYDIFLKQKLKQLASLDVSVYLSVFPNPGDNSIRFQRFKKEAEDLLHKWAHQNKELAFSKQLEILVDQQVFPEQYLFQYFCRRNQYHCYLFPKRLVDDSKRIFTDRENSVIVRDVNSKTHNVIQLTDLLVGCAREHYALNIQEYFEIVKPLFKKEHSRIQLTEYHESERGFIPSKQLGKW